MNRLTPAEATALGVELSPILCRGDLSYRVFLQAAIVLKERFGADISEAAFFTADHDQKVFREEAVAGRDDGQGTDEIPFFQLPESLVTHGRPYQGRRGAYHQIFAPIRLGDELVGMLALTTRAAFPAQRLDAVDALARALGPAVGYVLRFRSDGRTLRMLQAATRMSRDLIGMSGATSDRLYYHFVSLVVEHLKFDRATLVIFGGEGNGPARGICAILGKDPFEIHPERLPEVPPLNHHPVELEDAPGLWISIHRGPQKLGALLADNLFSLERPPADAVQALIDLTGHVALTLENTRLMDQLRTMALRDDLTGLFRPGYFYERLHEELLRLDRDGRTAALFFVDFDNFKGVNDVHGHLAGDAVLVQAAGLLRAELRSSDIICRLGGDEFVALLPGMTKENGIKLAERLCERIQRTPFNLPDGGSIRLSASVGVAIFPEHADHWQGLIHRADEAMYVAKRRGKGKAELIEAPSA